MGKIFLLLLVLLCGCSNERFIDISINTPTRKRGWFPNKCKIIEQTVGDRYNGAYNGCWVRPLDIASRNKYGYGYVNVYGEVSGKEFLNVEFKNRVISYPPFDVEKIHVDKVPLWALNRSGYYWEEK